jgi:hypothetical protein
MCTEHTEQLGCGVYMTDPAVVPVYLRALAAQKGDTWDEMQRSEARHLLQGEQQVLVVE